MNVDVEIRSDRHAIVSVAPTGRGSRSDQSTGSTPLAAAIAEVARGFGFVDSDKTLVIDVDLSRSFKPRRHSPRTPVEFYEARMSFAELIRPLFLPAVDCAGLRPFQEFGTEWLLSKKRAILADDMGLGKTIQAIFGARMLVRSGVAKQVLIVCPGILIPNWSRELTKWAEELGVCIMQPAAGASRAEAWRAMRGRMHVLLTTYDQLRVAAPFLKKYPADLLVLDEAHRLRNPRSQTSVAVRSIGARYVWALTGTPIERHPSDLIALLNIVAPGLVGESTARQGAVAVRTSARPLLLRRLKTDVLSELPASFEHAIWLALTPHQRISYDAAVREERLTLSQFALISKLRKICDADPRTGASSKIDFLLDRAEDIVRDLGQKIVVFSVSILPLELARRRLIAAGIKAILLTGRLSPEEREAVLEDFKEGDPCVLLASAKLASEGLTLTQASHVFFLNLWWNPSANNQARDRVLRIGQLNQVTVTSLLCANTIDEDVHRIVEGKSGVYKSITDMLSMIDSRLIRLPNASD